MTTPLAITLDDEAATGAIAEQLAHRLAPPLIVYLEGDLGVGKTTLVRGLLRALGHTGVVKSPTYGLFETYPLDALTVCHADLYRLAHPEELEMLGVRDWLDPGVVLLVEWPERGAGWLPAPDLVVRMAHAGGSRRQLALVPASARGDRLVADLSHSSSQNS